MSEVHTLSVGPTREPARAHATQQTLAVFIVMATALFNLTLCFVNTTLFGIGINLVIGSEIALIAIALALTWYRGYAWYVVLLLLTAYFFAVMLIRSEFDAKIVRDLLIPIVFFFLGSHLGSLRSADRLVTTLIFIALGAALFEFLELNTYLHYFDVIHYYQARGTEQNLEAATAGGIYIKGTTPLPVSILMAPASGSASCFRSSANTESLGYSWSQCQSATSERLSSRGCCCAIATASGYSGQKRSR